MRLSVKDIYKFTDQSYIKHEIVISNIRVHTIESENNLGICSQWRCARLQLLRKSYCSCCRGRWSQRHGSGRACMHAQGRNRSNSGGGSHPPCHYCWPCWRIYLRCLLSRTCQAGRSCPHGLPTLRRKVNCLTVCLCNSRSTCPGCAIRHVPNCVGL